MAKFFRRGVSKIYFLPAVADTTLPFNPTRAEITAGTDLSPFVNGLAGFQFANTRIDTPILSSSFTPEIDGPDEVGDSTLTFLDDDTSTTVRTALAKGTAGFIFLMPYGDVPTKRGEVWPVKSTGVNDEWSMGNDPARFTVGFAITDPPSQNSVIPAAA